MIAKRTIIRAAALSGARVVAASVAAVAAASGVAVVAGCGTPTTTERFFALVPAAVPVEATASTQGRDRLPGIVIAAVTVPELVDRPEIVTRDGVYRVVLSEQNQWAEPLKQGVGRVLAAQVRRSLAAAGVAARVASYPQGSIGEPVVRVVVDVQRFDATPGGEATVSASWTLRRIDGETRSGHVVASRPVRSTDYTDIVGAFNGALDDVGGAIGAAVVALGVTDLPTASR